MNWANVRAKWSQLKGRARTTWGRLTDDDLEGIRGKRDLLVGRLIEVYGMARDEAERQASEFARTSGQAAGHAAGAAKASVERALGAAKRAGRGALGKALGSASAGLARARKRITPAATVRPGKKPRPR